MIEVNELSKHYDYYKKELGVKSSIKNLFKRDKLIKKAVNKVSFHIKKGEIVGFLGPNGAGKTTTLKMLSGILYPTDGEAKVCGYTPWHRNVEFKQNISITMGQKSQLWWDLPAIESLNLNRYIYGISEKDYRETVDELVDVLEVKDVLNVQVRRLSLGQRMKLEIIAALIHKPKVIYLDEPTIGLDIITQKKLRDFIKTYNQKLQATIIITSHYMEDIEELCNRVIVINNGNLVYDGDLYRVNEAFNQTKLLRLQLDQNVNINNLNYFGKVVKYDDYNITLEVEKDKVNENTKLILNNLPVKDFTIENIPVEEGIRLLYEKSDVVQ